MDTINPDFVITELYRLGLSLKQTFETLPSLVENAEMMAAFKTIDGNAETQIRAALKARYPSIDWFSGEFENGESWDNQAESFWVCDALDGAVQFLRKIPQWCISLTLVQRGQPTASFIYDVIHGELFHALAGRGAFLNGQPIQASPRSSHKGALVATSQPPLINDPQTIELAGKSISLMLADAGAVRNLGPTSLQLAYVACGRLDAFWEYGDDTFNCLGASLLVREAGGIASDLSGQTYQATSPTLLAAAPLVHGALRQCLVNGCPVC